MDSLLDSPVVQTFVDRCTTIVTKVYSGTKRRNTVDGNAVPLTPWMHQEISPLRQLIDNISSTRNGTPLPSSSLLSSSKTAFLISNILDYMLKRTATTGIDFATLLTAFFTEKHGKGDTCNDIIYTFLLSCGTSIVTKSSSSSSRTDANSSFSTAKGTTTDTDGEYSNHQGSIDNTLSSSLLEPYPMIECYSPRSPPFGLAYLMCIATGTLSLPFPLSTATDSNVNRKTLYDYEPAFGGALLELVAATQRILSGNTPSSGSNNSAVSSSKSSSSSTATNSLTTILFDTPPSLLRTPMTQEEGKAQPIPFIARRITLPMALTIINDLFASSNYFNHTYLDIHYSRFIENCRNIRNTNTIHENNNNTNDLPTEIHRVLAFRSLNNGWSILNRQALLRFILQIATGTIKNTSIFTLPLPNYLASLSYQDYQYPNSSSPFLLPVPSIDTVIPNVFENVSLSELQILLSKPARSMIDLEVFLVGCLQLWIIEKQYIQYIFRFLHHYLHQQYTLPLSIAVKTYTENYVLPLMTEGALMARNDVTYHIEPVADAYRTRIQTMIRSIVNNSTLHGDPILAQQILLQFVPELAKDTLKIACGMIHTIANEERKTNIRCNELITQRMNAESASRAAAAIAHGATDVRDAMEKRSQQTETENQELRKQIQEYRLKQSTIERDLENRYQQQLKHTEERIREEYEIRSLHDISLGMDGGTVNNGMPAKKNTTVDPHATISSSRVDQRLKPKDTHDITYYEHANSSSCCVIM